MNTTSVSWYILLKCMKYNGYGKVYALYLLLQCVTDERPSNHFGFETIISINPVWQRKHKCLGVNRVNLSAAMVTS